MTIVLVPPTRVVSPSPRPPTDSLEIADGVVTALFTSEFQQIAIEVLRVLRVKDLANLVAEFTTAIPTTHADLTAYVSIVIDEDRATTGWYPSLAQFLSAYWPLRDFDPTFATNRVQVQVDDDDESVDPASFLLPSQVAGAEALAHRRGDMVHTDPMDIMIEKPALSFTRDGYVVVTSSPSPSPPRATLTIKGCLLKERTGTGKSRTALEALRRIRTTLLPRPTPPRGRTAVNAVAIVVPPHCFPSWKKEIDQVLGTAYRVISVRDTKSLVGLAEKIKDADIVLFNECVFTTNPTTTSAFSASAMDQSKWTKDHEVLWTTYWPVLVLDEAHSYAQGGRPAPKKDVCYLPRKAVFIKSLLVAEYTILISATPQLDNVTFLDVYAYLMGAEPYPSHRNLHDLARSPGSVKVLESYAVPEESKVKTRNLLFQKHVVTTDAKLSLRICEMVYKYRESYFLRSVTSYLRDDLMRILSEHSFFETHLPFVDRCRRKIINDHHWRPIVNQSGLVLHQSHLRLLNVDEVHKDKLGEIFSSSNENQDSVDQMNFYTVENTLAPIHVALIRIIAWLVDNTEAKFLIYDATSKNDKNTFWDRPKEFLKRVHNIDLLQFGGPMSHLNRKRKLLMDKSRTGLFLPNNHIDGANFPFVTHVIVVGKVRDADVAKYEQFIGRGTRRGRTSPMTVVKIEPTDIFTEFR
jgi:hypothetical protein